MTVGMPSKTGAGTIDANADGYGKITYMSADEWKTDVTLAYTLNGENKTLTVSNTAQPEFMDFLWLDPQYLSGNSSTTNKVVSDTIKFRYGKNDRHTYDGHDWLYLNLPLEEIKQMALASLKDNTAMYFSCDVAKFLNRKTGVCDLANYNYGDLVHFTFAGNVAHVFSKETGKNLEY